MDAETIAASLTKAQQEALASDHWQDWRPLLRPGLVYWGNNGRDDRVRLKTRPAFHEIRAILKGQTDGE